MRLPAEWDGRMILDLTNLSRGEVAAQVARRCASLGEVRGVAVIYPGGTPRGGAVALVAMATADGLAAVAAEVARGADAVVNGLAWVALQDPEAPEQAFRGSAAT